MIKTVCSDIHTTLPTDSLTCLIGPNGVGKSTLMRTLSGFQPPLQGEVMIDGKSVQSLSASDMARRVGVVLTSRVQVSNMTVRELVGIGRSPYTNFWGTLHEKDAQIVEASMQQVGILSLSDRKTGTLSDGEKQKTMIAKALAQQTPYILLDEPTAFLDYPSKVELLQMLHHLSHEQHKTILLSTHDVELALQLADYLWLILDGKLLTGTPQQLAEEGCISQFLSGKNITFDAQRLQIHVQ